MGRPRARPLFLLDGAIVRLRTRGVNGLMAYTPPAVDLFRRPLDRILIILSIWGRIDGRARMPEERLVLPGVEAPAGRP
jgi:hypothetical protein